MRKWLLVAALWALGCAGSANAMNYGLVTVQDGRCTSDCPLAIFASGTIHGNEAERFLAFFQGLNLNGRPPRNFIVSSPGGDLVGSLDLGLRLRRLGMSTMVGSVSRSAYPIGAAVVAPGTCGSACVFVLMAGVTRVVVPGSRVAVHSPQVVLVGRDAQVVLTGALSQMAIRGLEPLMQAYAREMGVRPGLIAVAHRVPNETRLTLTSADLSRYGLVTGGSVRERVRRTVSRPRGSAPNAANAARNRLAGSKEPAKR
jgi:hypothetical protein